jgi:hypothetical protein
MEKLQFSYFSSTRYSVIFSSISNEYSNFEKPSNLDTLLMNRIPIFHQKIDIILMKIYFPFPNYRRKKGNYLKLPKLIYLFQITYNFLVPKTIKIDARLYCSQEGKWKKSVKTIFFKKFSWFYIFLAGNLNSIEGLGRVTLGDSEAWFWVEKMSIIFYPKILLLKLG